jgi:tetratricopeptide (TPR) repeat protein
MRRSLSIDEASFGPDHPNVAIRLNNLAQLLQDTNRLSEAEPLLRRSLAIDEASFGPDHPKVAIDLNNLATLLYATNRLIESEPLMRRSLSIDEASFGPDHPDVARDLNNLAQLLQDTNRLIEAEPLIARAVCIHARFDRSTGHEHPNQRVLIANYRAILASLKLTESEVAAKIKAACEVTGPLAPMVPEVERILGPAKSTKEVFEALDRQYRKEGKPAVWFLPLKEPIAPHLDELLGQPKK